MGAMPRPSGRIWSPITAIPGGYLSRIRGFLFNPLQEFRNIDYVSGRLLMNFNLNSLYRFICVRFAPNNFQSIQSAKNGLV